MESQQITLRLHEDDWKFLENLSKAKSQSIKYLLECVVSTFVATNFYSDESQEFWDTIIDTPEVVVTERKYKLIEL